MNKSGAFVSVVSIAGFFCLGAPCRAENILELIFGFAPNHAEAHRSLAPARRFSSSPRRFVHKRSHEDFASAHDSAPSPEMMKLSYAEVWGSKPGGSGSCCINAADMIARVTKGDPTLRQGDALMTSDGLQVFVDGVQGDPKFVPIGRAAQLSRALKERLQAIEKAPSAAPAPFSLAVVSSSRSHAERAPGRVGNMDVAGKAASRVTKDRLIAAPDGKTIRLVGGAAN
jgi:hypothetical protein